MRTSWACGGATSTSSTLRGSPAPQQTAALHLMTFPAVDIGTMWAERGRDVELGLGSAGPIYTVQCSLGPAQYSALYSVFPTVCCGVFSSVFLCKPSDQLSRRPSRSWSRYRTHGHAATGLIIDLHRTFSTSIRFHTGPC